MRIGLISDTHDEYTRTQSAMKRFQHHGVEAIIHSGDLFSPRIIEICSALPFYFCFGNHDADVVPALRQSAINCQATCLGWGDIITLTGKTIAVCHGHLTFDLKPLLTTQPDYLISGHSHIPSDTQQNATRRINPGALFRADRFTIALLDLTTTELEFLEVN